MSIDPDAALAYLGFVDHRHRAWERRQLGVDTPDLWSDDPIIRTRKFTNVFRILDPGTQFILTDLMQDDDPTNNGQLTPRDALMRLFLYRHTGRIEVWQHLWLELGRYPLVEDLDEVLKIWQAYRGDAHVRTRTSDPRSANRKTQTDFKKSIFTSAYLVFPQSQVPGTDKLESIINLTKRLFEPDSEQDIVLPFMNQDNPRGQFTCLRMNKGVADFMSMQILTDWGYTHFCGEDREDDFIVLGPGARKGAAALDPTVKPEKVFEWAVSAVRSWPTCPTLEVPNPGGSSTRLPSWMDVQNTLCEFSKYVRFAAKPVPDKQYVPAHPGPQPDPVLPRHWQTF